MIIKNEHSITFTLNDRIVTWEGSAAACLLDVLRDYFRNTGVKCGCREGECGACSVIMDGRLVNSCMIAMGRADGTDIITIEGFKKSERFAVLNKAFAETSAVQCGFCTPGMVLAAESLLQRNPHPSEHEIRIGLSGNLCRCTGYNAIVQAVVIAAKEGEGLW